MKCRRYSSRPTSTPNSSSTSRYAAQWRRSVSASTPSMSKRQPRITGSHRPRLERVVQLAPLAIALVVVERAGRARPHPPRSRHRADGVADARIGTEADGREDRAAEARALDHRPDRQRHAERTGHDAHQGGALRHAAAHREPRERRAARALDLLAVAADGVGDALDVRA